MFKQLLQTDHVTSLAFENWIQNVLRSSLPNDWNSLKKFFF